jgi:hypothetical protein
MSVHSLRWLGSIFAIPRQTLRWPKFSCDPPFPHVRTLASFLFLGGWGRKGLRECQWISSGTLQRFRVRGRGRLEDEGDWSMISISKSLFHRTGSWQRMPARIRAPSRAFHRDRSSQDA